jgi:hypothetical protein
MRFKIFCCLSLVLFVECSSKNYQEGVVMVNTSFVYADDKSAMLPPFEIVFKIIYKRNLSIQEVPVINFHQDSTGQKYSVKIKHYSYLDPDKNICLNYKTFSDTAKVWTHYPDIDSVTVDGGWNFLSNSKIDYDSSANLSDTVINGITYGRNRLYDRRKQNHIYFDVYTDCTRKNTLVEIFKPISDSLECPIVREETYIKGKIFMTRHLEFVSARLSSEERGVLDAWEKNVKNVSKSGF